MELVAAQTIFSDIWISDTGASSEASLNKFMKDKEKAIDKPKFYLL